MNKVLIPGSFDPLTLGHLDIINTALSLFDEVHIVIFTNFNKKALFTVEERMAFLRNNIKDSKAIITSSNDLSVKYAKEHGLKGIVKGIRNTQDMDYEMQISHVNAKLCPNINTIWIPASQDLMQISSGVLKELVTYHQDISAFVPKDIALACEEKLNEIKNT